MPYGLKIYAESSATPEQRAIISYLVEHGVPAAKFAERFAWPLELIDLPDDPRFGYLMPLIDNSVYISAANLPKTLSFGVRIEAARQLAECFRELHIAGFSYMDISDGNYFMNPATGDVILIDNDNVCIDQMNVGGVLGTGGFMAPEVVRGEARPSTVTDMHSLSILIFTLLCGNHPMHGAMHDKIRIFDPHAVKYLYGTHPVFVFDPKNRGNALPNKSPYNQSSRFWSAMPGFMKALFVQAFTDGLHNPGGRVTDIQWVHALSRLLDMRHLCSCGAENFWDPQNAQTICWHCGKNVNFPSKLYVCGSGNSAMLILPGQMLTTMHLGEKSSVRVLGEIEPHPKSAGQHILRNLSGETWHATAAQQIIPVPPKRAVTLSPGIEINLASAKLLIR
jgi:DNA-binding helix-hairpin-helix protein with protein kinase domain